MGKLRLTAVVCVPVSEPGLSESGDSERSLGSASLAAARSSNVCINTWNK